MREAQYYAELARAYQGSVTRHEMRWEIDLTEGYSLIHAAGILAGEAWIWPDARLSKAGRTLIRLREAAREVRAGSWHEQIDL